MGPSLKHWVFICMLLCPSFTHRTILSTPHSFIYSHGRTNAGSPDCPLSLSWIPTYCRWALLVLRLLLFANSWLHWAVPSAKSPNNPWQRVDNQFTCMGCIWWPDTWGHPYRFIWTLLRLTLGPEARVAPSLITVRDPVVSPSTPLPYQHHLETELNE